MRERLSRGEFLKLISLLGASFYVPPVAHSFLKAQKFPDADKNILIVVYDAFSAHNIPFHGYTRETTPNLSKLAERAIVYHNAISAGNFTTPGTASLLSGVYPWTHRAFNHNETLDNPYVSQNLFHAFPHHHRFAFTHNPLANTLLTQIVNDIDVLTPPEELFLYTDKSLDTLFEDDQDIANVSWVRGFEDRKNGYTYSLFLSYLYELIMDKNKEDLLAKYSSEFPRGIPQVRGNYFLLESATDYLGNILVDSPQPFLGYYHFFPPHVPYATHIDFYDQFANDGFKPYDKPEHIFTKNRGVENANSMRLKYDEYLLYVDHEFGRLFEFMDQAGLTDNTYIILTSDHGELFERGIVGHTTPVVNQPVIRVPMMIFEPGRSARKDVFSPVSNIDILPTLLNLLGGDIPEWCEGKILPPFGSPEENAMTDVYSMYIRSNQKYGSLQRGSIALFDEPYKLLYYFGYDELAQVGGELVELYDIQDDPEELRDLGSSDKNLTKIMLDKVKNKLDEVNRGYP